MINGSFIYMLVSFTLVHRILLRLVNLQKLAKPDAIFNFFISKFKKITNYWLVS